MKDYIRLGLAAKTAWPDIDFGAVEIIEILPRHTLSAIENMMVEGEVADRRRWHIGKTEFRVGYAHVSNMLLVGIKE